MLRLSQIRRALAWQARFRYGSDGACFGVTDPSRLRPPSSPLMSLPPSSGDPSRRIVMVDDGQGNMVPDDQLPEKK